MCCPPEEIVLFPNEYEEFSSSISSEDTVDDIFTTDETENYTDTDYVDDYVDNYVDNVYYECPHQCVPPTFCDLTGAHLFS